MEPPDVVVAPPSPRSPPKYPDLCGRRRLQLELQILNREIGFIEEELQSLDGTLHVSRCCKEVNEYVGLKSDPLMPMNKRKHKPSCMWRWLRSALCCSISSICCSSGCMLELAGATFSRCRCARCCTCSGNPWGCSCSCCSRWRPFDCIGACCCSGSSCSCGKTTCSSCFGAPCSRTRCSCCWNSPCGCSDGSCCEPRPSCTSSCSHGTQCCCGWTKSCPDSCCRPDCGSSWCCNWRPRSFGQWCLRKQCCSCVLPKPSCPRCSCGCVCSCSRCTEG